MAKSRIQKKETLNDLSEKIGKSKSVVFANFGSLTVKESEDIRKKIKAEGGEYFVAKKTLFDIAFKEKNISGTDIKSFGGRIAAVFGYQDEVSSVKAMDKFRKTYDGKIEFAGGILENKFISKEEVAALAKLPSKQELLAKLVGTINAPVSGFVNALAGNIRNFVQVLKAIEEKR